MAPPHLNLPLFGVCVCYFLKFSCCFSFLCWFCVCCFCFVFGLHRMSEKGRATPLSTLRPGVEHICFGSGWFGAQTLECMKEDVLRWSAIPQFLQCVFAKCHSCFWDMFRQIWELPHYPREIYPTIHVFPSYVTQEVDSVVTLNYWPWTSKTLPPRSGLCLMLLLERLGVEGG